MTYQVNGTAMAAEEYDNYLDWQQAINEARAVGNSARIVSMLRAHYPMPGMAMELLANFLEPRERARPKDEPGLARLKRRRREAIARAVLAYRQQGVPFDKAVIRVVRDSRSTNLKTNVAEVLNVWKHHSRLGRL